MGFDGVIFLGQGLKVRRPRDYVPIPGTEGESEVTVPGAIIWVIQVSWRLVLNSISESWLLILILSS